MCIKQLDIFGNEIPVKKIIALEKAQKRYERKKITDEKKYLERKGVIKK